MFFHGSIKAACMTDLRTPLATRSYSLRISQFQLPPAPPPPPRADPRALALFLLWMANSRGWGLLSCQIPRGRDERGQMPRPPSTLQHFSLIA